MTYDEKAKRKQIEFYDKYPLCFLDGEPECGFYCNYGWWPLIDKLCSDITNELSKLSEEDRSNFRVTQIKAKFGELRFYVKATKLKNCNDKIYFLIHKAEAESKKICELCSSEAKLIKTRTGMFVTQCDSCQEE